MVCNTPYFKYSDADLPIVGTVSSLTTSHPCLVTSSFTFKKAHTSEKFIIAEFLIKKESILRMAEVKQLRRKDKHVIKSNSS